MITIRERLAACPAASASRIAALPLKEREHSQLIGAVCVALVLIVSAPRRSLREGQHLLCGQCTYDLTGLDSDRCPECGALIRDVGTVTEDDVKRNRWWGTVGQMAWLVLLLLLALAVFLPS